MKVLSELIDDIEIIYDILFEIHPTSSRKKSREVSEAALRRMLADHAQVLAPYWPTGPAGLAQSIGLSEIQLERLFNMEEEISEAQWNRLYWLLGCGGDRYAILGGNVVLIARNSTAALRAYNALTDEQPPLFAHEIVPTTETLANKDRLLMFCAWGRHPSVIVIPREGGCELLIDPCHQDRLPYLDPAHQMPDDIYRIMAAQILDYLIALNTLPADIEDLSGLPVIGDHDYVSDLIDRGWERTGPRAIPRKI